MSARLPTGVARLDELLDGGFPSGSAVLVYGPPFIGKEILTRTFLLEGARDGMPGVMVLTNAAASDVSLELAAMDPRFHEYEKAGLIHFVDTYSKSIGAEGEMPNAEYLDGPVNLNALALAVGNVQRKLIAKHPNHRLVFDSLSTLIAYTNPQTAFRFLQVLVGKAKRAGATSLLLLDQGMHTDAEVQMLKHLMDGIVEMKPNDTKFVTKVDGCGVTPHGWIEYRFSPTEFEITGSFATGRIL